MIISMMFMETVDSTHLKLLGSLLKVISSCLRNLFMPVSSDCGVHALVVMEGVPSNTMTRSAR